ncbi:MAG: BtrH N-terminal domain-containing protein [Burkholderiaceae bacterium]
MSTLRPPDPTPVFAHRHAAHCESGVVANLLTHQGVPLSEPMAFGLAGALGFAYLPFVRIQEMPLIAYRMQPRAIIRGVSRALGVRFRFETFRSNEAGERRLDALLDEGRALGAQTSIYWLGYCPEDMRFHFNAHNLVIYGRDGHDFLISDPVIEHPVRCSRDDMDRARFARGMLAPKGLLYYLDDARSRPITPALVAQAIRRSVRNLRVPLPLIGCNGMRTLARRLRGLDARDETTRRLVGHVVRMQEEIGTGGAGFRFLYAAFLQEAADLIERPTLADSAQRLLEIGDAWRDFALQAALMIRERKAFDLHELATRLDRQAEDEAAFFTELGARAARC